MKPAPEADSLDSRWLTNDGQMLVETSDNLFYQFMIRNFDDKSYGK